MRVNEHLQVEGHSNIYAIGDCADLQEPKMAYHAGLHASIAVANIVNTAKQRPLKAYKPGLGPWGRGGVRELGLEMESLGKIWGGDIGPYLAVLRKFSWLWRDPWQLLGGNIFDTGNGPGLASCKASALLVVLSL